MFDMLREIGQTLSHNKLRLALTGFAVAWGIFMLIILLSLANGLVNGFSRNMVGTQSNTISVWGGMTAKPWKGYKEGRAVTLHESDMKAIAQEHGFVDEVVAKVENDTVRFSTLTDQITGFTGVFPSGADDGRNVLVAGRFINNKDMETHAKVVMLEESKARLLFGDSSKAVGQRLRAMNLDWQVVGVYSHRWRETTFVPYSTAAFLAGNSGEVSQFDVQVKPGAAETEEEGNELDENLRTTLAQRNNFDPTDNSAVWIWNRLSDRIQSQGVMNILVIMMWTIGILTLLSGIVGVSNIMFVSVRERTHEIGIRRAIGARRRNILSQIILESVCITTIFGYIGIVLGTLVMGLLSPILSSMEMFDNPSVNLTTAFEVTVVLIIAGGLAGLFPALKATKVKPVEALRDE